MTLVKYSLVSFTDEDEFINGINFGLLKEDVELLIEYFKSCKMWTEYYFYEIGDFCLTQDQVIDILDLRCPYWSNPEVQYSFSGWSVNEGDPLYEVYKKNGKWKCLQSIDKKTQNDSHFFVGNESLQKAEHLEERKLSESINKFDNVQFDTTNYSYRIASYRVSNLIFDPSSEWLRLR